MPERAFGLNAWAQPGERSPRSLGAGGLAAVGLCRDWEGLFKYLADHVYWWLSGTPPHCTQIYLDRITTMSSRLSRRHFLKSTAVGSLAAVASTTWAGRAAAMLDTEKVPFKISLAQWSLHKTLQKGELTNMQFPEYTKKEFGIDAVEYVNSFFKDKARDNDYLTELKQRCEDLGVRSLLIMCDGEGQLGDPNEAGRKKAVENHHRWVEAAKFLGCHSIRVNAQSSGDRDTQRDLAADGLGRLGEFAKQHDINVIVENHGGLSSDGEWLVAVMNQVDMPNVGTLPDFGNFYEYDRYQGVKDLMPFAKAVSAKSKVFNDQGEEANIDYRKMMDIVLEAGYDGYVGIEWEGGQPSEPEGIRLTQKLLEKIRSERTA
jgi:sugar phosphate isomerase/epimerase